LYTRWLQNRLEDATPELEEHESEALRYITDAWEDAVRDGIDPRVLANVALFLAVSNLVETYGETAVIRMAEGLKARVERGEFTLDRRLQ